MAGISKASMKTFLGMAVRAEIDSNEIYTNVTKKVANPLLKEKFTLLAFEEDKHKIILEKLIKHLFKGEKVQIPDKTDERLLPSIKMTPSSSLVDILYQAMEAERAAQNFYERLAKRFKKPQRDILMYLGKVEKSHYAILRSEYTLAQEFEDYAEKDIDKVVT